jgi:hypothetical protein
MLSLGFWLLPSWPYTCSFLNPGGDLKVHPNEIVEIIYTLSVDGLAK